LKVDIVKCYENFFMQSIIIFNRQKEMENSRNFLCFCPHLESIILNIYWSENFKVRIVEKIKYKSKVR